MSLVVTLRIAEGVVIAADSLATIPAEMVIAADIATVCPKCNEKIQLRDLPLPPVSVAASTSPFAQKVFPFQRWFGVATFGSGILNGKTIYHHVREAEMATSARCDTVTDAAEHLGARLHEELKTQLGDLSKAPQGAYTVGLHVVGYDGADPKTKVVQVGREVSIEEKAGLGCTVSGQREVVRQLWELGKSDPRQQARYPAMSLQDAIDYAKFLIRTTADYQRFANMIPTVGGEIDIGFITPYQEFTWIQQKHLTRILEERRYPSHVKPQ